MMRSLSQISNESDEKEIKHLKNGTNEICSKKKDKVRLAHSKITEFQIVIKNE